MVNSLPVRLRDLTLPDDLVMAEQGHTVSVVSRRAGILTDSGGRVSNRRTGHGQLERSSTLSLSKMWVSIVGVDADFFVRHYDEAIYENGIHCRDMVRLKQDL